MDTGNGNTDKGKKDFIWIKEATRAMLFELDPEELLGVIRQTSWEE